jgi:hypothetical protein
VASFTFFGVQVAVRTFFNETLRDRLHALIAASGKGGTQTLQEKRAFWKRLSATLNEAMPVFERGHWDLIRDGRAETEFETWSAEIEGALATETEELGSAADEVNRLSSERRYMLVTMMFLVELGSNADQTLGERCDIPESAWHDRQTFARLIATPPLLNFANIQADAVYLVPGNDQDGLSEDDLAGPDYAYLKPLG